jgi:methionyl aminopeptidase
MEECEVESASYGYGNGKNPFPRYICVSVNREVVHGIGRRDRLLEEGDIVSLDVAVRYNGFVGDNTKTVCVGKVSRKVKDLVQATEDSLIEGIAQARVGHRVGHISAAIQRFVESKGYRVVRQLVGHGVGREMHEDPPVPNFGQPSDGPFLQAGMTLAIEPMVVENSPAIETADDGWTVFTKDGGMCAHFEHTVLISKDGPEILTKC